MAGRSSVFTSSGWNIWDIEPNASANCKVCKTSPSTGEAWRCSRCAAIICGKCAGGAGEGSWADLLAKDNLVRGCHCQYPHYGGLRVELLVEAREKGIKIPALPPLRMQGGRLVEQVEAEEREAAELTRAREEEGALGAVSWGTMRLMDPQNHKVSAGKQKITKLKRKTAAEDEESDVSKNVKDRRKRSRNDNAIGDTSKTAHLHHKHNDMDGHTTIIIGAGVIGLSVARELALTAAGNRIQHTIIVIDIRDKPCTLASAACAGILTARKAHDRLEDLFVLASEAWQEIFDDRNSAINFQGEESVRIVSPGDSDNEIKPPSWFDLGETESLTTATSTGDTMGRVTTSAFTSYLYDSCKRLGVQFIFNSAVIRTFDNNVDNSKHKNMNISTSAAEVVNLLDNSRRYLHFSNLVIAAGPYTTGIFRSLYTYNTLPLENHVRCIPWYRFTPTSTDPNNTNEGVPDNNIALIHPSLAPRKSPSIAREITFSSHSPNSTTILISTTPKDSQNHDLTPNDASDPPADYKTHTAILALKKSAGPRIPNGEGVAKLENSEVGYSFVSTASEDGLPVIARVPREVLGRDKGGAIVAVGGRVWLCYGFGMHGTAVAPGAARVCVRKMFGRGDVGVGEWVVGFKGARGG